MHVREVFSGVQEFINITEGKTECGLMVKSDNVDAEYVWNNMLVNCLSIFILNYRIVTCFLAYNLKTFSAS